MTSDLDIYLSVKLLIDQHGEDAPIFAAMQADKCLEGGDLDGKRVPELAYGLMVDLTTRQRQPPTHHHDIARPVIGEGRAGEQHCGGENRYHHA